MPEDVLTKQVKSLLKKNPTWGRSKLASAAGVSPDKIRHILDNMKRTSGDKPLDVNLLVGFALKQLKKPMTPASLADSLGCDLATVNAVLAKLSESHSVAYQGAFVSLTDAPRGFLPIQIIDGDDWTKVGLVADTHLGCQEERLDALHAQYDIFEREGIVDVLHAGNPVDGYIPRINGSSVFVTGIDGQVQYFIDNYPQRKGMTTHFITGDDHEGWWMKEGFNFGAYLEMTARKEGRDDLDYIGHVEADVAFESKTGKRTMVKVQHPGGGSSYARSYTGQKQVEAFQGGEKPAILIQGHYHVTNYMVERNIHVIGLPGFEDQTIFARKKRLRMDVGGALLKFKTNLEDGAVTRCSVEFNMYFDRGYYKRFLRSDAKLIKGNLVIGGKR